MSTFIVAELSANHGGRIDIVKESIIKAKEIGCDALKIQTINPYRITIDCNNDYFQIKNDTLWDGETLHSLYQRVSLPWEWHKEIFDYAKEVGLIVFSTPFDNEAIDLLEDCGNPIYKIASFEITDTNLIRDAALCGKPMIISTGIATEEEIEGAVSACRKVGNNDITLLQCTSEYPARLEDANLNTMVDMGEKFGVKIGLSDHTLGSVVATTAVAMGASVVEKHFTLDKSIDSADSAFSLDTEEFKTLVRDIRDTEKCLGSITYDLSDKKRKSRKFARSLFVVKDVEAGELITYDNVWSIRPGDGLPPKYMDSIVGKVFLRRIKRGTPLSFDDISD